MNDSYSVVEVKFTPHSIFLRKGDKIKLRSLSSQGYGNSGYGRLALFGKTWTIRKIENPYIIIQGYDFSVKDLDMEYLKEKYAV